MEPSGLILGMTRVAALMIVCAHNAAHGAAPEFHVSFPEHARAEPATGRLVVYLIGPDAQLDPRVRPADGPFFRDPQPMLGVDVRNLHPGETAIVGAGATTFPPDLTTLTPGRYRAQAVLDVHRADSSWQREPGNLHSEVVEFQLPTEADARIISIELERTIGELDMPEWEECEIVEIDSALLTAFRGEATSVRCTVVEPIGFDPASDRRFPALYVVPGFGGTHLGGYMEVRRRQKQLLSETEMERARRMFMVYLDPEGPNGHHLFANSANNGPVEDALLRELIPALEERFPLVAGPEARLLTGHSSGGWSAIWLALRHPDVFAGAWASAPDPVDFRRFQLIDIYSQPNIYFFNGSGDAIPSAQYESAAGMTVREENLMEEVLGPRNTSAQQWDSWQAVFGPRAADGNPAALFDPITGEIDRAVAARYRAYDIGHMVRSEPDRYIPLLRRRVRVIVGSEDTYSLDEAVILLRDDINRLRPKIGMEVTPGYIRVIDGFDHGGIRRSDAADSWAGEMLLHLRRHGLLEE